MVIEHHCWFLLTGCGGIGPEGARCRKTKEQSTIGPLTISRTDCYNIGTIIELDFEFGQITVHPDRIMTTIILVILVQFVQVFDSQDQLTDSTLARSLHEFNEDLSTIGNIGSEIAHGRLGIKHT